MRDAVGYVRRPRATAARAMRERRLGEAAALTVVAIALTAVPPTLVPASDSPPRIPRAYAVGLTWLGDHRAAFALLAFGAMLLASALGYALTCALVRLLRPATARTGWRTLLTGLGWINALSVLSALIPLPGVVMQIARVPGYIPVDVVLVPPAIALGVWVGVPACWTLRDGAGLTLPRALAAFLLPLAAVAGVTAAAVIAGFQLAWGAG